MQWKTGIIKISIPQILYKTYEWIQCNSNCQLAFKKKTL